MPLTENEILYQTPDGVIIPLEWATATRVRMSRGEEPAYVSFGIGDEAVLKTIRATTQDRPGVLIFRTPGDTPDSMRTLNWHGWHIVRIEPQMADNGLHVLTLADVRWRANYKRIEFSINQYWPDGQLRSGGLFPGLVYTTKTAIIEAVTLFGMQYDEERELLTDEQKNMICPKNLGNSKGGGYVQGAMAEIFPPLTEHIGADLIMTIDGKVTLVKRSGDDNITMLREYPRIVDTVATGDHKFELAQSVKVSFEVMMEGVFEVDTYGATGDRNPAVRCENVMPKFQYAVDGIETEQSTIYDTIPQVYFKTLEAPADESEATICANWFKPLIAPYTRANAVGPILDSADVIERKDWFDDQVRPSWRSLWRVKFQTVDSANPLLTGDDPKYLRAYSGIKFGRLTKEGGVNSSGAVWMDHSYETNRAVQGEGITDVFQAVFSVNMPYSSFSSSFAPFRARWVAEAGNELVFQVSPNERSLINKKEFYPAMFSSPLTYGSWLDIAYGGEAITLSGSQGTFLEPFKMRVIWAARLVADRWGYGSSPSGGELVPGSVEGRRYTVTVPLFPEGIIDYVHMKSRDTTANLAYTDEQIFNNSLLDDVMPDKLLNGLEIDRITQRVANELKVQMKAGLAGGILVPGCQSIADNVGTGGDIHEAAIKIGMDGAAFSIMCEYQVLPNINDPEVDRKSMEGKPAPFIDQ